MSERFIPFESENDSRLAHEERVLKSTPKTKAGRWLAAMMLAMSAQAAVPSAAKAQDFFQWYQENFSTRFDLDAAPSGGGGMVTMTIRERSEEDRRRVRHEPDLSIIHFAEPDPFNPLILRSGLSETETEELDRRAEEDRAEHPEDYEGVEPRLRSEVPVHSDLIDHGAWETELLPDQVYIDEQGRRFLMRTLMPGISDFEAFSVGAAVHRWLPGRVITHDARRATLGDGARVERYLFEAPPVVDTARLEGNWYDDLRPARFYVDDHERILMVADVAVPEGRSIHGYREDATRIVEAAIHHPVVVLDEHIMPHLPLSDVRVTEDAEGRSHVEFSPRHVRYLIAERITDSEGHPIDPEAREREAMRHAWEHLQEIE